MRYNQEGILKKIIPTNVLSDYLLPFKNQEKTIAFTNGCFDLLHPGHINTLLKASQLADLLVVGLNSDLSIQRLKGLQRPINKEFERSYLLASLAMVDAVIIFDDDTPAALIKAIKPHFLVKGGDYIETNIVGYDFVRSYGGKIIIEPTLEGYSTTSILNKIQK